MLLRKRNVGMHLDSNKIIKWCYTVVCSKAGSKNLEHAVNGKQNMLESPTQPLLELLRRFELNKLLFLSFFTIYKFIADASSKESALLDCLPKFYAVSSIIILRKTSPQS